EADSVAACDQRRVSRAHGRALAGEAGGPVDRLWTEASRDRSRLLGVVRSRPVLDELIARRVRRELDEGLVAEIEAALAPPGLSREAAQINGVREVISLRGGQLAPPELPA